MSKFYRDAAWRTKLKPERKVVLLFLAERADDLGICWPSMTMIAEACEITQRGVEKIVAAFIAEGLIERVSLGGGRGNPSKYHLLIRQEKTPNGEAETPNEITPNTETPNQETPNETQTPNTGTGFNPGNPEPQDGVCDEINPERKTETPNEEAINPEREVAHNKNNRHGTVMQACMPRAQELSGPADDFGGLLTQAPGFKSQANGQPPASRYSLDTVKLYVVSERRDARSVDSLARTLWLSGDNDERIAEYLERARPPAKPPPCPECAGQCRFRIPNTIPVEYENCKTCLGRGVVADVNTESNTTRTRNGDARRA